MGFVADGDVFVAFFLVVWVGDVDVIVYYWYVVLMGNPSQKWHQNVPQRWERKKIGCCWWLLVEIGGCYKLRSCCCYKQNKNLVVCVVGIVVNIVDIDIVVEWLS